MRAANDGEPNRASFLGLGNLLGCAWCSFTPSPRASELFCVGENEVHVLVECEHLPNHLSAILQRNFHAVVD